VIRDQLADALRAALATLEVDPMPATIALERPARREHGDWSSNVALATAKRAGRVPRELADELAEVLSAALPAHVRSVTTANPGFVNFHLADSWLHEVLTDVVDAGVDGFGRLDVGAGTRVNVEFVSANPTGPLHAGHGRGAAYGDSLARLFERCGYQVSRENYLNDRGTQMAKFAASLAARKAGTPLPEDGYAGDYVVEWAEEMPDDADPAEWGEARAIEDHRRVLERMNVHFDTWFSERSLLDNGAIDATLADLREHGVVYEADDATWLRSTQYGDDKDRVLVRRDGEPTYLLPDIAYHRDKFARGFDLLVDVWGADHHGHVTPMRAALQALGHDAPAFQVPLVQLVHLMKSGEPVRISKRTGDIIELGEVLDEVGPDAARLTFLLQSVDSPQTFDLDLVASQAMENPVFYVQMAYARLRSIVRVAGERGVDRAALDTVELDRLGHERELDVLRALATLPEVVAAACADRTPHRITTWVRELAGAVHGFYHDCYVLGDDVPPELTQARLWLVEGATVGLAVGLDLLGVGAPESM
jgi:arginyl-tRNA synthetase